ncbi:MAG: hypothetical protein KDJ39_05925 [Gammaproteobacteria bacterium]|nr:hypothetical protein [Gammaproteobacteria bacterium]
MDGSSIADKVFDPQWTAVALLLIACLALWKMVLMLLKDCNEQREKRIDDQRAFTESLAHEREFAGRLREEAADARVALERRLVESEQAQREAREVMNDVRALLQKAGASG